MLITLASIGGIIHIGSQSKFIPYVVQVDKLGETVAAGPVTATATVDPRILTATVSEFISSARMVTPDVALQRKAILKLYSMLSTNDPATGKMNEWLNGVSPFKRAENEMVSVEIKSVLAQTKDTWQVDWLETTRDRLGVVKEAPKNMRSLITVSTTENTPQTTEEQIRLNPLGIYIRDFSWSGLQ
jgi:type IV secretion system protein VirB5